MRTSGSRGLSRRGGIRIIQEVGLLPLAHRRLPVYPLLEYRRMHTYHEVLARAFPRRNASLNASHKHTHIHTYTHAYARTRTHMHTTWSACAFRRLLAAASDSTPSRSFPCSRPPVKASADVPAFVSTSASSISTSWPAASCALGESSRLKSFSRRFCKTGHDTSPLHSKRANRP